MQGVLERKEEPNQTGIKKGSLWKLTTLHSHVQAVWLPTATRHDVIGSWTWTWKQQRVEGGRCWRKEVTFHCQGLHSASRSEKEWGKGSRGRKRKAENSLAPSLWKGRSVLKLGQFAAFSRPWPEECQRQPEQAGLCQSLHSAPLSNCETRSVE